MDSVPGRHQTRTYRSCHGSEVHYSSVLTINSNLFRVCRQKMNQERSRHQMTMGRLQNSQHVHMQHSIKLYRTLQEEYTRKRAEQIVLRMHAFRKCSQELPFKSPSTKQRSRFLSHKKPRTEIVNALNANPVSQCSERTSQRKLSSLNGNLKPLPRNDSNKCCRNYPAKTTSNAKCTAKYIEKTTSSTECKPTSPAEITKTEVQKSTKRTRKKSIVSTGRLRFPEFNTVSSMLVEEAEKANESELRALSVHHNHPVTADCNRPAMLPASLSFSERLLASPENRNTNSPSAKNLQCIDFILNTSSASNRAVKVPPKDTTELPKKTPQNTSQLKMFYSTKSLKLLSSSSSASKRLSLFSKLSQEYADGQHDADSKPYCMRNTNATADKQATNYFRRKLPLIANPKHVPTSEARRHFTFTQPASWLHYAYKTHGILKTPVLSETDVSQTASDQHCLVSHCGHPHPASNQTANENTEKRQTCRILSDFLLNRAQQKLERWPDSEKARSPGWDKPTLLWQELLSTAYHTICQQDKVAASNAGQRNQMTKEQQRNQITKEQQQSLFPGQCHTTYALRKFLAKETDDLLKAGRPENLRKLHSKHLAERVTLPELVDRVRSTTTILREFKRYQNVGRSGS